MLENGDRGHRVVVVQITAAVLGEADPSSLDPLDLPLAGLAPQLGHQFIDLAQTGGPDRVAPAQQAARDIDRDPAPEAGGSGSDQLDPAAKLQLLIERQFRTCRGIVQSSEVRSTFTQG